MPQVSLEQALDIGVQHHRAGRLAEAEGIYRKVLAVAPNHPTALQLLGALAAQVGKYEIAIELTERALAIQPGVGEYHLNLGECYRRAGKFDKGLAHALRAVELCPQVAGAHANLGYVYRDIGRMDEAKLAFLNARALAGADADLEINLGNAHWAMHEHEAALAAFRRAVAMKPDDVYAHWSVARVLLQMGEMGEGWEEFEWRLKHPTMRLNRGFEQPQWDGSDLGGKRILLHAEGGLGDALQFVRFVPIVARRGGKVILECQAGLVSLFQGVEGVGEIVTKGKELPGFDVHIPFQGLPRVLGVRVDNVPNQVPYVRVPEERAAKWAGKIPGRNGKTRVGLVWAGSPNNDMEFRSRTLEMFNPFLNSSGFQFFSLQMGEDGKQRPPVGIDWVDLTSEIGDMADTAALVDSMDLVISVDTSTAHLAGALGKKVWVLIPSHSDFRWLLKRTDTPWYPTMRLFRQRNGGKWEEAAEEIAAELVKFKS
jgi:Flp pilus assembly protein TadD